MAAKPSKSKVIEHFRKKVEEWQGNSTNVNQPWYATYLKVAASVTPVAPLYAIYKLVDWGSQDIDDGYLKDLAKETPKNLAAAIAKDDGQFPPDIYAVAIGDYLRATNFSAELSEGDYAWALSSAFGRKYKPPRDVWKNILLSQWKRLSKKKYKDLSQAEINWFIAFYKFPYNVQVSNGNAGQLLISALDGKPGLKVAADNLFVRLVTDKNKITSLTKILSNLNINEFSKKVKDFVTSLVASPVSVDAGAAIGKVEYNNPSGGGRYVGFEIHPINIEGAGNHEQTWRSKLLFGTLEEAKIAAKIPENPYNWTGNGFRNRKVTNFPHSTNPSDTTNVAAINGKYEVALNTALTEAKLNQFLIPGIKKSGISSTSLDYTNGETQAQYQPAGIQSVADLRDLPEKSRVSKELYDSIENQIYAGWIQFINSVDFEILGYKETGVFELQGKQTQQEKFNQRAEETAKVISRLFASAIQREVVVEIFESLNELIQKDPNMDQVKMGKDAIAKALKDTNEALRAGAAAANSAAAAQRATEVDRLTEDEINEKRRYIKQCALITNFKQLKEKYHQKIQANGGAKKYFDERFYMVNTKSVQKRNILNHLFTPRSEDIKPFMNLTPDLVAALTPKIRLFKIYNSNKCNIVEQEFPFKSFEDESRISALREFSGIDRGNGAGIKNFKLTFEGTNPAEARSAIAVEMTMFFQSFEDLIRERKGKSGTWKYVDLILHPHDSKAKEKISPASSIHNPYETDNVSNYRIRADIGWNNISGRQGDLFIARGISVAAINKAINRMNKTFYLVMVDHEMDIKENGSVELKVSFRAYIETALQDKRLDALSSPEIIAHRLSFGRELNKLLADKKCTLEQYKELRATYTAIDDEFRLAAYRSIMKRMFNRGKIHFCKYQRKDISANIKIRGGAIFEGPPKLIWPNDDGTLEGNKKSAVSVRKQEDKSIGEKAKEKVKNVAKEAAKQASSKAAAAAGINPQNNDMKDTRSFTQLPALEDQEEGVSFFMIGDLLHTVLDCMYEPAKPVTPLNVDGKTVDRSQIEIFNNLDEEAAKYTKRLCHLKNLSIVIPSFEYQNPDISQNDSELISINVAEIPVSVDYFLEFMNQKVIKGQRKTYPVMDMIRDLTREVIINILSEKCLDLRNVKKLSFAHTAFVSTTEQSGGRAKDKLSSLVGKHSAPNEAFKGYIYSDEAYEKGDLPLPAVESHMKSEDFMNYLVLFPKSGTDKHNGTGNSAEDAKAGVYHFEIGARKGILKKIKFAKTDMQYLREARFLQQGNDGLLQLGAVYKATLDLVGNTLYYPGMNLWIEPTSLGNGQNMDPRIGGKNRSAANALGFGGYHLVNRVTSEIGPGKFNTTVEAIFTYSGDGSGDATRPKNSGVKKGNQEKDVTGESAINTEDRLATSDPDTGETIPSAEYTSCKNYIVARQAQLQAVFEQTSVGLGATQIAGPAAPSLPPAVSNAVGASGGVPVTSPRSTTPKDKGAAQGRRKYVNQQDPENPFVWNGTEWREAYWVDNQGVIYAEDGVEVIQVVAPVPPEAEQELLDLLGRLGTSEA